MAGFKLNRPRAAGGICMASPTLDTLFRRPYCLIRFSPGKLIMADTIPPLSVKEEKGIRIVEFTHSKILDEANISAIQETLNALVDENENPRLLLDFANVEHL